MILHTPALHLLITSMMASTPVNPATCGASDLRCTGQANTDAARLATSSEQRAKHLYRAHRAYLALADSGPEPQRVQDLCRARQLLKQASRLPAPDLHARLVASAAETDAKFKATGIECPRRKRGDVSTSIAAAPLEPPPLLPVEPKTAGATESGQSAAEPTLAASASTTESAPSSLVPPSADLLPIAPRRAAPATPHRQELQPTHPGRGLLIGGGVTLSVGLALTGAAGYMGGRLLGTWRDSRNLHAEAGPLGTEYQAARDAELASDYQRLRAPTLAMAVVGGTTLVVGAVLVGVGARRFARVTSRAALLPMPGGLVFRARF